MYIYNKAEQEFCSSSSNSAPLPLEIKRNGMECPASNLLPKRCLLKQYTISSVPFRDLPLVRLCVHFPASPLQSRLSWAILTFTLKCQQNHLRYCLLLFYGSRSFVETMIKTNKIGPNNSDWSALVGKCIHYRTSLEELGKILEGAEPIMYYFRRRHLWGTSGSKLHAGYSIPLAFLSWMESYSGTMSKNLCLALL